MIRSQEQLGRQSIFLAIRALRSVRQKKPGSALGALEKLAEVCPEPEARLRAKLRAKEILTLEDGLLQHTDEASMIELARLLVEEGFVFHMGANVEYHGFTASWSARFTPVDFSRFDPGSGAWGATAGEAINRAARKALGMESETMAS